MALWSGAALGCVISAEHPVSHSLGLGPFDDLDGHWPQESALVHFQFVDPGRRRRRIRGVGDSRRARRGDDGSADMIPRETEAEILRLFHAEKWRIGTIARELGVHHTTVRRVLRRRGRSQPAASRFGRRWSIPFVALHRRDAREVPAPARQPPLRDGAPAGLSRQARSLPPVVARYRPRPAAEAYLRLRTLPGEQAQVDWAHFGKLAIGRADARCGAS